MAEKGYIKRELALEVCANHIDIIREKCGYEGVKVIVDIINQLKAAPNADTEKVRCKNCTHHHWEQEPCHGKTVHTCNVLDRQVSKNFYCGLGKRRINNG